MGRKAKLKKIRQQAKEQGKISKQYDSTQFVQQFEQMGYQLQSNPRLSSETNQNSFPEIPEDKIEPQI